MKTSLSPLSLVLTSIPGKGQFLLVEGKCVLQDLLDATPHTPPLLQDLLRTGEIAWQYRNETTIAQAASGENPAVPWLVGLAAWGGTFLLKDGREVPVADYLARRTGGGRIDTLRLPVKRENYTWGAAHVSITPADRPIVLAAAVLAWEGARIAEARLALTGVSRKKVFPVEAIAAWQGKDRAAVDAAAFAAQTAAAFEPPSDYRGSAEYRRAMAEVVIRRALEQALSEGER